MHSIFDKVLSTEIGKKHVREHEHYFDAQESWKKLVSHYTNSTKSRTNATNMLSYVTSENSIVRKELKNISH